MGKNIVIAFVSTFSALEKMDYSYSQDGETRSVSGMLTNEAPIKYLLREYPAIDEILCLVYKGGAKIPPVWNPEKSPGFYRVKSEEEMKEKTGGRSPYDYLEAKVKEFLEEKEVVFNPIDYDESGEAYFAKEIIPKILANIHADDIIYLETTGGFRVNITQMMLLTHILNYQGTKLACAVYSDFQKKKIFDVTDSYRDFDLVNGMNEFVSTGATGMLESHFKGDETAKQLIEAMKKLTEAIMLARIALIEKRKIEVQQLLEKAEQELQAEENADKSILTVLLPFFRTKYSQISTIPELIKWCAANNLIQAAFTLYKEWIPKYLMDEKKIIKYSKKYPYYFKDYTDNLFLFIFTKEFFKQSNQRDLKTKNASSLFDERTITVKNIGSYMTDPKRKYAYKRGVTKDDIVTLMNNYLFAELIRNDLNHAVVSSNDVKYIEERKDYLREIENQDGSQKYIFDIEKQDIAYLKEFLIHAMDQIIELANR